jgi:hypothetical protein
MDGITAWLIRSGCNHGVKQISDSEPIAQETAVSGRPSRQQHHFLRFPGLFISTV